MNNILILEPFYSHFHVKLAKRLSNNIEALVFNLGNLVYLRGVKKHYVHKKILQQDFNHLDLKIAKKSINLFTEKTKYIDNHEVTEDQYFYMARYVSFIRQHLKENNIDFVIMHNDLRWQHALAITVCHQLKIKYMVTERGLFRPDALTIDFKGVNANNSLPRDSEFYLQQQTNEEPFKSFRLTLWQSFKKNWFFSLFLLLNILGDLLSLNVPLKNKHFLFYEYTRIALSQLKKKSKRNQNPIDEPYVFVPLQVNSDTQILVHSEYTGIQEFISQVEKDFYQITGDFKLVFKLHPMEEGQNYQFDTRSIASTQDAQELLEGAEFIITINSTVGFEALQKLKKVIVLGEAFYKIPKITISSSPKTFRHDLKNVVENKITVDKKAIAAFIHYVKNDYQINGNLFNWSEESIQDVILKIKKLGKK